MSMQLKMKNDCLLIQEIEQEEATTAAGIIIPADKYNRRAIVINPGDAKHLKAGDVILKNIGKGTVYNLNDEEFEIIHIGEALAVIENNA